MWEPEENSNVKAQALNEPPTLDFNSLTRTGVKSRQTGATLPNWRRVIKFAKVPYKVHTDR